MTRRRRLRRRRRRRRREGLYYIYIYIIYYIIYICLRGLKDQLLGRRTLASRPLAFGVWGVLHFRECWRRLGGGGPVRGAGVFGTLICTHEPWYGGEKGGRRLLLLNPRPTLLLCSSTCRICIVIGAAVRTQCKISS